MGGLSAAAHLSAQGHRVKVFESQSVVGGKAGRRVIDGFRFDTGPTLLTMPEVIRRAFSAVNASFDQQIELLALQPETRYFFANGRRFDCVRDAQQTAAHIDAMLVAKGEGARYREFLKYAERVWSHASEPYLEAPFTGYLGFMGRVMKRGFGAARLGHSLGTLNTLAEQMFVSDELRAFVARFATYVGGDPAKTSAAYANIAHLECTHGATHPRGGMAAIAYALADSIKKAGVEIVCGAVVEQVLFSHDRVHAVKVRGAERVYPAQVVIVNVDPLTAARTCLSTVARALDVPTLAQRERSVSCYALLLGVEGGVGDLAHHNVYFPGKYADEFDAIYSHMRVCDEPTVYVNVPSVTETQGVSPAGCHSLFALINAPATGDRHEQWCDDSAVVQRIDRTIVQRINELVPGIAERIIVRSRVTPMDIEALGSVGGAIYGEAPHGPSAPFRRPKQRVEGVKGLYLVGGSVHPGGGVPMVTLGGEFAAKLAARDFAS
jgi:phytoene desaturase